MPKEGRTLTNSPDLLQIGKIPTRPAPTRPADFSTRPAPQAVAREENWRLQRKSIYNVTVLT